MPKNEHNIQFHKIPSEVKVFSSILAVEEQLDMPNTLKTDLKSQQSKGTMPQTNSENLSGGMSSEGVKSTAVVKYSVPKPANFLQLQCNTDLKVPPSNWLTNSTESYGLQHALYSHKGFTSFRMAHMFPDCVGEVDVVSDSENIKNLLKIPYNKGHISMMVHRVENTLLLDDFDMYKHLLRTAESEWEWLRKFFNETVESDVLDEERLVYIKNKRQKALKQKHLVSKFLYHSLVQDDATDVAEFNANQHQVQGPSLPEPPPDEETPDAASFDHKYNRNVVWTFEDIEMLIGTDMPIFGGGTHPCISLRLRDMKKPINVLTGIDYWLDNLMSNVPEVVMCYHLDGIVQKYELVKTEDLPSLKDSKFNPELIRDVAQSILSFLKSNATKAGHTYWLFKGKDEDVVKLYDLTSLCSNDDDDSEQNPFTVPVAMLLYRVARNMKHSRESRQPGTIRMLLKNCIKLLNEEKYPEIVTSSHYMLSDLYVPVDTNPENPKLDCSEDERSSDDFWNYDAAERDPDELKANAEPEKAAGDDIKTLTLSDPYLKLEDAGDVYKHPPPIAGSVEERALQALGHIDAGINCLQYFKLDFEKEQQMNEEANIQMAKPNEPIPMPYEKLQKDDDKENKEETPRRKKGKKKRADNVDGDDRAGKTKHALLLKNKTEAQPLPTWQGPPKGEISWKEHLKTLLYEKAVLVYAILSEDHYGAKNYGSSLRYLGLLVRTLQVMSKLKYSVCNLKESCILGRAGDCCVMISQSWGRGEEYRNQFHTHTEEDLKMLEKIEKDEQLYSIQLAESCTRCVLIYDIRTIEQVLLKAVECYQEALKLSDSDCLMRRLANSLNEVGTFYLNKGKTAPRDHLVAEFGAKSEPYLKRSVEIFERIKDEANIALVYTNIGHLHRLLAHASTPNKRGELTAKEKFHYGKAFANYNKALQVIGDRKHSPNIWDAVKWELSTALFTMATIAHENPAVDNIQEAEKEVIEVFQRALKACDFDENNPKYPLYQYRAATIYYRLGSLYHKHIWSVANCNEANRKSIIQLSKLNYEKASKMFFLAMDCVNYLTAQMQRFALTEYIAETATNAQIKYKHLQQCLDIVMEIGEMIHQIVERNVDVPQGDVRDFDAKRKNTENYKSCSALLILVKQRLQHVLKILIKTCLQKPPINRETPKFAGVYKQCYAATFDVDKETTFFGFAGALDDALTRIAQNLKSHK